MIGFLRHAQAQDDPPPGGGDDDRLLTPLGEKQAIAAGKALSRLDIQFAVCISSPKLRARLTAEVVCKILDGLPIQIETSLSNKFDAMQLAANRDVLLVGHEPSMSYEIMHLTGAQVRLRRGGFAQVGPGEVEQLWLPSAISAIARMPIVPDADSIDLEKEDWLPPTTRVAPIRGLPERPKVGSIRLTPPRPPRLT